MMTIAEAHRLGAEDGKAQGEDHGDFDSDPLHGEHYDEVIKGGAGGEEDHRLVTAYHMAFDLAYAEAYNIGEFFSQRAVDLGAEDGKLSAAHDHHHEDEYRCDPRDGQSFGHIPTLHENEYAKAYTIAYAKAWAS
jgi:hypothetical protein